MKRKSLGIAAVGMFIMVLLLGASIASAGIDQWTYGVPIVKGEGGDFTGNEAMVSMTGIVKKIEPMYKMKDSLQMQFVAEEGGKWIVYLGPKWFIEHQKIKFAAGDKVEVRGKKYGGAIIASEISKGDWTMRIRNEEDGQAVWQCCFPYKPRKD